MPSYEIKWIKQDEIGFGGQGSVFLARRKGDPNILAALKTIDEGMLSIWREVGRKGSAYKRIHESLETLAKWHCESGKAYVLKILNDPTRARDPKKATERMEREIQALKTHQHPNLIPLIDCDAGEHWFITEYYSRGTLAANLDRFKGDFIASLKAIRPLVQAVSTLHEKGYVHRDIKPLNIFLSADEKLVLGDFGLHFDPSNDARLTGTESNVGSWQWMPPWAEWRRQDDVSPTFDVYSLAKTLWAMVSNLPMLQRENYEDERFNVEKMFPGAPGIEFANALFRKTIVDQEDKCLANATKMDSEISRILQIYERRGSLFSKTAPGRCIMCCDGEYRLVGKTENISFDNVDGSGFTRREEGSIPVFCCAKCGHIALFGPGKVGSRILTN